MGEAYRVLGRTEEAVGAFRWVRECVCVFRLHGMRSPTRACPMQTQP